VLIGIQLDRKNGVTVEPCADVILSATARRVILNSGGGAPIDFFLAAAVSIKCRRRRRVSQE